jgi:hypothetical protein
MDVKESLPMGDVANGISLSGPNGVTMGQHPKDSVSLLQGANANGIRHQGVDAGNGTSNNLIGPNGTNHANNLANGYYSHNSLSFV